MRKQIFLFFPMLVRYTRMTAFLRRAQEFFPHSFRSPQAKLHTWPSSLIHNRCNRYAPQGSPHPNLLKCHENWSKKCKGEHKRGRKNRFGIVTFCPCDQYVLFGLQIVRSDLHLDNASPLGKL